MPEIAIAGLPIDFLHSGTAVYVRNLSSHLPTMAPDLSFRLVLRDGQPPAAAMRYQRVGSPFRALSRERVTWARLDKLAWETWSFPLAARRADLFHFPYFAAPVLSPAPVVVTIHDLIPLVVPDYHRGRASAVYSRLMRETVRRASAIITVSEHSRQDILRVLRVPSHRVHLTYEAADERFSPNACPGEAARLRERYALADRYLLYIGGAERRKNIETLVRAWADVVRNGGDGGASLVIVARFPPPDALYPDILGLVDEIGLSGQVQLISSVDEEDKPALYRHALALCFPSTHEGFGLTPLEAMATGTPVISSNATSLPEVVGDAGILLDPRDTRAWTDAMQCVVRSESERSRLGAAGLQRAARFSWRHTAEQTAAVYRQVLA